MDGGSVMGGEAPRAPGRSVGLAARPRRSDRRDDSQVLAGDREKCLAPA
jgi:hypothetical protein